MSTPHKHAALIHAWADGAEIESRADEFCRPAGKDEWTNRSTPLWHPDFEYRVKPHRWQAEIDAQKAGKAIQARVVGSKVWIVQSRWNFEVPNVEFRIKPETIRFRLYKYKSADGRVTVESHTQLNHAVEHLAAFLGWASDWQEVEA